LIAAAATSFARSAGTQIANNIGGKSTSKKNDSVVKKATKTAVNTATRKVTTEILKSILK
jgi:hypothetical protein